MTVAAPAQGYDPGPSTSLLGGAACKREGKEARGVPVLAYCGQRRIPSHHPHSRRPPARCRLRNFGRCVQDRAAHPYCYIQKGCSRGRRRPPATFISTAIGGCAPDLTAPTAKSGIARAARGEKEQQTRAQNKTKKTWKMEGRRGAWRWESCHQSLQRAGASAPNRMILWKVRSETHA